MMEKQILLVDDEVEIAELLAIYLKNEGYRVHVCACAREALECLQRNRIDLALLDIMLPDMDGFALLRKIREQWYFPILMVTARVGDTDKINGIMLGADDYIVKPFNPLEVTARVRAQLRRVEMYNPAMPQKAREEIYEIRGLEVNAATHTCLLYGEAVTLTPLEFSILLYLCKNAGRVIPAEELFEKVWGEKYLDCNNTIMAHIAKLREKLKENARQPKFIKTVWGVGYKIEK